MTDTNTITLSEAKQYLRIAYSNDDTFITSLITMAKQLIKEQTGVEYTNGDEVYKIAVFQAVAHFYDKRESYSEKNITTVPYTLDCLIKHIGLRGPINE